MGQMFLALVTCDDEVSGGGQLGLGFGGGAFEFITSPTRLKYGLDLM